MRLARGHRPVVRLPVVEAQRGHVGLKLLVSSLTERGNRFVTR